jgi:REP element-mobilizing transposase RayT
MPSRFDRYATHHTSRRTDGWDYTQAATYFVTLCTHQRAHLFGPIANGRMALNAIGRIVDEEWRRSEAIRDEMTLDAFVVMPNHLHGIVVFTTDGPAVSPQASHRRATLGGTEENPDPPALHRPPRSLGSFVAGFKSAATTRINQHRGTPGAPVWQRNYHDRIIRTERHLWAARRYIRDNPAQWADDRHNREDPQNESLNKQH